MYQFARINVLFALVEQANASDGPCEFIPDKVGDAVQAGKLTDEQVEALIGDIKAMLSTPPIIRLSPESYLVLEKLAKANAGHVIKEFLGHVRANKFATFSDPKLNITAAKLDRDIGGGRTAMDELLYAVDKLPGVDGAGNYSDKLLKKLNELTHQNKLKPRAVYAEGIAADNFRKGTMKDISGRDIPPVNDFEIGNLVPAQTKKGQHRMVEGVDYESYGEGILGGRKLLGEVKNLNSGSVGDYTGQLEKHFMSQRKTGSIEWDDKLGVTEEGPVIVYQLFGETFDGVAGKARAKTMLNKLIDKCNDMKDVLPKGYKCEGSIFVYVQEGLKPPLTGGI
jgi:hypothetical protein